MLDVFRKNLTISRELGHREGMRVTLQEPKTRYF